MIRVDKAFAAKNNIKRTLFSDYVSLHFIGQNKTTNVNGYIGSPVTKDFSIEEVKVPLTGEIRQRIRLSDNPNYHNYAKECVMIELRRSDATFIRFSLPTRSAPTAPNFEWIFEASPNKQDKALIS